MSIFFTLTAAFIAALGLAVGSFLNVVIYRLPHGVSLARPRWSFCPQCGESIAGRDNLPVISWLLLRGKCRNCHAPISGQYPIVEAMTALIFTLIYFLLMSQGARAGISGHLWVDSDWPYVLACLTLAAAMIACSAMDITSYSLDVRVTEFAVVIGVLMHAVWRRGELHMPLAVSAWGAAGTAAAIVAFFMLWISNRRAAEPYAAPLDDAAGRDDPTAEEPRVEEAAAAVDRPDRRGPIMLAILLMLGLTFAIVASGALGEAGTVQPWKSWLAPLGMSLVYIITILASSRHSEADAQVHEEIEAEAQFARGTALAELLWLTPAILAGAAAYFAVAQSAYLADMWRGLIHWSPAFSLHPVGGVAYALSGLAIAAAAGWALRLFFTFVFGREAFGTGDIYLLAATGATIGPDIAALGLLAAVALAMLAWMLAQLWKSTTLLPFGPPLAIGFLVALWLSRPAAEIAENYRESLLIAARERPQLLWLLGGVLCIGMGAAILAAKVVRRIVDPPPLDEHTPSDTPPA